MNKQSNFIKRMINLLIWVPILIGVIFFMPVYKNLALNCMFIFFAIVSGIEMGNLLKNKDQRVDVFFYPALATIFPALEVAKIYFPSVQEYTGAIVILVLLMIMIRQVMVISEHDLDSAIFRVMGLVFTIFYPGFLSSYLIKFIDLELKTGIPLRYFYLFFFLLVMLNDGFAYIFGMLLGKITKSQGYILVSPNKSIAGFTGGFIMAMTTSVFFYYLPKTSGLFADRGIGYAIIMGLCCGLATIGGDLFESTLKRSANVKDSGNFFMGRGGILDSIDSLIYTAPVFYYFVYFA